MYLLRPSSLSPCAAVPPFAARLRPSLLLLPPPPPPPLLLMPLALLLLPRCGSLRAVLLPCARCCSLLVLPGPSTACPLLVVRLLPFTWGGGRALNKHDD